MSTTITYDVKIDSLADLTDEAVAKLWHLGQANPAPFGNPKAGAFYESIGREIIQRWLAANEEGAGL